MSGGDSSQQQGADKVIIYILAGEVGDGSFENFLRVLGEYVRLHEVGSVVSYLNFMDLADFADENPLVQLEHFAVE